MVEGRTAILCYGNSFFYPSKSKLRLGQFFHSFSDSVGKRLSPDVMFGAGIRCLTAKSEKAVKDMLFIISACTCGCISMATSDG